MAEERNVIIGITDVRYAVLLSGDTDTSTIPTYDTTKVLFQTAEFGFDPAFSQVTGYYDNGPRYLFSAVGEMAVTLKGDNILSANFAEVMGMTYANGILVDNLDDEPPYIALMGTITRSGGVTEKFCLPKVQLGKGAMSITTKQAQVSPQNVTVSGRAVALTYNSCFKTSVRSDDPNVAASTLSGWYSAPVYSTSANLNALGVTSSPDAAGSITITFAKTGAGNFILDPATVSASTIQVINASTGAVLSTTRSTPSTTPGATQTVLIPATGTIAAATYILVVDGVKDAYGVTCTLYTDVVTVS